MSGHSTEIKMWLSTRNAYLPVKPISRALINLNLGKFAFFITGKKSMTLFSAVRPYHIIYQMLSGNMKQNDVPTAMNVLITEEMLTL